MHIINNYIYIYIFCSRKLINKNIVEFNCTMLNWPTLIPHPPTHTHTGTRAHTHSTVIQKYYWCGDKSVFSCQSSELWSSEAPAGRKILIISSGNVTRIASNGSSISHHTAFIQVVQTPLLFSHKLPCTHSACSLLVLHTQSTIPSFKRKRQNTQYNLCKKYRGDSYRQGTGWLNW